MSEREYDEGVGDWITRGLRQHPDPEAERHPTDEVISAVRRRADGSTVEALLELVGHEIRTPLTVIEGSTRMLLDESGQLSADQQEHLERAHRNAVLALLLLDRLAQVRRVDEDDCVLSRWPVDLVWLVNDTVEVLREAVLGTRSVRINAEALDEAVAEVDPGSIRQIIFNLLASAALNTPPGAPINITIRDAADAYEVEVRDDGHGVAPEDAEAMFEKFPRLDATRQGPGVGLYVSRGLARAHGGDLDVVPSGESGIFVLRLPKSAGET